MHEGPPPSPAIPPSRARPIHFPSFSFHPFSLPFPNKRASPLHLLVVEVALARLDDHEDDGAGDVVGAGRGAQRVGQTVQGVVGRQRLGLPGVRVQPSKQVAVQARGQLCQAGKRHADGVDLHLQQRPRRAVQHVVGAQVAQHALGRRVRRALLRRPLQNAQLSSLRGAGRDGPC